MLRHYDEQRQRIDRRFDDPGTLKAIGGGVRMSNMDIEAEYERTFHAYQEASAAGKTAEKAKLSSTLETLAKARWGRD
jgi:hypothetical protein